MGLRRCCLALLCGLAVWLVFCPSTNAETPRRLALVIGNAAYASGRLPTAANDAGLIAQSLAQDGFAVTAMSDVDTATARALVGSFAEKIRQAGPGVTVFVYLAGRGVQIGGDNFLLPVDAKSEGPAEVAEAALPLAEVENAVESLAAKARYLVYDLARGTEIGNEEAAQLAVGLTLVHPPRGSLHAFGAAPGAVARDDLPLYGLYARALAEALRTPGLTATALFARVRLRVAEMSRGEVVPWDESRLETEAPLAPEAEASAEPRALAGAPEQVAFWTAIAQGTLPAYQSFVRALPDDPMAPNVKTMIARRLEAETWAAGLAAATPSALWTYMLRYPHGPHYVDVRRRLATLHASLIPPPRFDLANFAGLPAPTVEQLRLLDEKSDEAGDRIAVPAVPDTLLPPPAPEIFVALAPPPLVPKGVLPIPAPFLVGAERSSLEAPGLIEQPMIPGLGSVSVQSRFLGPAAAMTLATADGLVTRAVTSQDKGQRTITQTDAADEIVSRTTVTQTSGLVTITQTGPDGKGLATIVTRIAPLGDRVTTITNGRDERVAEIRANKRGVLLEMSRGDARLDEATFVFPADATRPTLPAPKTPPSAAVRPASPPPDTAPSLPPSDLPASDLPASEPPPTPVPPATAPEVKEAPAAPAHQPPSVAPDPATPLPVPRPPEASKTRPSTRDRGRH